MRRNRHSRFTLQELSASQPHQRLASHRHLKYRLLPLLLATLQRRQDQPWVCSRSQWLLLEQRFVRCGCSMLDLHQLHKLNVVDLRRPSVIESALSPQTKRHSSHNTEKPSSPEVVYRSIQHKLKHRPRIHLHYELPSLHKRSPLSVTSHIKAALA